MDMVNNMNDHDIELLLKSAGKRIEPSAEAADAIRQSTQAAWKQAVAENTAKQKSAKKSKALFLVATAASLLVAVLGMKALLFSKSPAPTIDALQPFAQISHSQGHYYINDQLKPLNTPLAIGDTIKTDEHAILAVVLKDQTQMTFSGATELVFQSANKIKIVSGRIYVDSPDHNTFILIQSEWGSIKDIGTQYQVSIQGENMEVAMREGKVEISLEDETTLVAQSKMGVGDVLSFSRGTKVAQSTRSNSDPAWNWTRPALAHKNLDGLSVYDLIHWSSRVTGKKVVYASLATSQLAKTTHLSGGQLDPLDIEATLPRILRTTTLSAVVSDLDITVSLQLP